MKRMVERGISPNEVYEVLEKPLDTTSVRFGRKACTRHFSNCHYVVVVIDQKDQDLIVVTAIRTNRKGALRYGFTRI